MPAARHYLDWNATAPLAEAARLAATAAMAGGGNPSSLHAEGRSARRLLEAARQSVAGRIGAAPDRVIFTSGATEANAIALSGRPDATLAISTIEHVSVAETAAARPTGAVLHLAVDRQGRLDLAGAEAALHAGRPGLVSVMFANNETGVIQPIAEIAALAHAVGAQLHVDCAQGFARLPIEMAALGCDLLTLSGHKAGALPGTGVLVFGNDLDPADWPRLWRGGGQEFRQRPGTENLAGIAALGAVAAEPADWASTALLRDRFERELLSRVPDAMIFGAGAPRLPNTSLFALPGLAAEIVLVALDLAGVAVSSGAACSSGVVTGSHVLAAMGVAPAPAAGAVRVSLGPTTTAESITALLSALDEVVARSSRLAPLQN